jgi:Ulp1 family protease
VDKIFDTALRQPKSTMQASSSRKDPDDLILAQKKSEARHAAEWNRVQDKKKASTNSNRIIDQLQADSEPDRSERNTRSTRSQLSLHHSDDDEPSPSFKNYEVTPDAFYGGPSTRRRSGSSVYEILPSTRATEREPRTRQLRPRAPSPPPLRSWTRDNPNWTRNWHSSIIYPAVGKDRARVDMGDIEKLDEGEFLNDNLIVFYLRWLQDQLEQQHPEWAKRIYFQNTFFYQKLSNPEKGMKGINYEAVKKWTSKVDLLSKDYIIIPINEHSHWYVAVICNAPKLLPGGETTDHSQSQGTNELPEDEGTNAEDGPKASLAPIAPPKPTPDTASGGDVDVVMRDMSLEEKIPGGTEELPSDSNSVLDEQDVAENDNPPPANVTSDLLESGTAKASQTKKSKRKSLPPQRKYNPKEFRIITLDSLGSSHTGTCSNLKDYLVLEIKDKKDIEIPRPGSIGTTAKGIPTQNNYYDCGLFLLSYVEMFLQNPDGFISGILQNDLKENIQWPKAPEMRARIRDLLFNLQKYQLAEAERLGKLKGKGKKTSKTEDKSGSASTSKLSSREASKSARASPDKPVVGELQDIQEKIVKSKAEPPTKEMPPKSRQSVSAEPAMAFEPEKSGILSRPASPVKIDVHKPGKPTQRDVGNVDTPSKRVAKGSGGMLNRLLSGTHKYMTGLLNNEKPATLNASNSKSPKPDIIEIKESPKKVDSGMQDSSRTIAEESPEILESGHSNVERNKQATSRTRRQHDAQSSRQGLPKYNRHDLTSPTPDAMDAPRPVPARREVQDLRSPSPPVRNRSTTAQEQWTVALKKRNLLPSADRERSVKAPSPEVMQTPSHVELDHRSAQYTENGSGNSREATDDEFKRFVHEEVADSEDEDTDDDAVDFVKMHTRSNGLSKPEDLASDEEMLMQPSNSQEEAVEDADSSLLSAPVVSSPPSGSASNKHREGQKSAPSSPVSRYENSRRGAATSPARGTKRKNPGTGESDNWQDHRRPSPVERDALDQAMIGEHVARGAQGGRHTRFLS